MFINHFITTISRGGAENQLLILCKEQARNGHEVTVTPLKGPLDLLDDFKTANIKIDLSLHGKNFVNQIIRKLLSPKKKNVIQHAHLPQAELVLAMAFQRGYIVTRHYGSTFFPGKPRIVSRMLSLLATVRSKSVIAISRYVADFLVVSGEVQDIHKIFVVPYGFDSNDFLEGYSRPQSIDIQKGKAIRVGSLSRLSQEKDLPTLIKGFSYFCLNDSPQSTLSIFGEGSEFESLKKLIADLKMTKNVYLMGKTSNPAEEILKMDVFVHSSIFEGFGMVYLEAMAASRIILASKIPAAMEVLGTEGAASFFEVGDATKLSLLLRRVFEVDLRRMRLSQVKQLELFQSKKMAKSVEEIYCKTSK